MNRGFYASTAGLNSQMARMKAVSDNIANSTTSGYKRDFAVISPFHEMMLQNMNSKATGGNSQFSREIGTIHQGAMIDNIVTDFSKGVVKETGRNADLALKSEGFFRLQDGDGNYYYTRNGSFNVDSEGFIRHTSGHRLTGEGGPIQLSGSEFTVSEGGVIESGGEEAGRIYVSTFEDNSVLQKTSDTLYTLREGEEEIPVETPAIKQGFKEESNVSPAKAMTTAMEVLRAYGAGQKLASAHDELTNTAIRQVGGS